MLLIIKCITLYFLTRSRYNVFKISSQVSKVQSKSITSQLPEKDLQDAVVCALSSLTACEMTDSNRMLVVHASPITAVDLTISADWNAMIACIHVAVAHPGLSIP